MLQLELEESFATLVDEIHHVDPNFDFEKVAEIALLARLRLLTRKIESHKGPSHGSANGPGCPTKPST